jgi:hypothetical protein
MLRSLSCYSCLRFGTLTRCSAYVAQILATLASQYLPPWYMHAACSRTQKAKRKSGLREQCIPWDSIRSYRTVPVDKVSTSTVTEGVRTWLYYKMVGVTQALYLQGQRSAVTVLKGKICQVLLWVVRWLLDWLASRGPKARICTGSHIRLHTRLHYLETLSLILMLTMYTFNMPPSNEAETHTQTELRLTIQVYMQHQGVTIWKLERTVCVFCGTEKRWKEKDSRYIQRIMRENFDASRLATRHRICNTRRAQLCEWLLMNYGTIYGLLRLLLNLGLYFPIQCYPRLLYRS